MKLSEINQKPIVEGFSRSDFFNMYLLLYASAEPQNKDDQEIQRLSKFYVNYILNDLVKQLVNICAERFFTWPSPGGRISNGPAGDFLKRRGYGDYEEADLSQSESKNKVADFLRSVINKKTNESGGVWKHICAELLNALNAYSHREKVVAIDRLMNMLHHGGEIIEYLDERSWLSQALNYRDNASPAQLARFASGQVREVVGNVGGERGEISTLRLLSTAVRRAASEYPNTIVNVSKDSIEIKCSGILLQDRDDFGYGPGSIWFFAGGSKTKLADRLGHDSNARKVAEADSLIIGKLSRNAIIFTDKFKETKTISLPINDYYRTANYLVRWMVTVAESSEIQLPEGFWD